VLGGFAAAVAAIAAAGRIFARIVGMRFRRRPRIALARGVLTIGMALTPSIASMMLQPTAGV
jgi:hypothetical protein